jgi:hypothetical protein
MGSMLFNICQSTEPILRRPPFLLTSKLIFPLRTRTFPSLCCERPRRCLTWQCDANNGEHFYPVMLPRFFLSAMMLQWSYRLTLPSTTRQCLTTIPRLLFYNSEPPPCLSLRRHHSSANPLSRLCERVNPWRKRNAQLNQTSPLQPCSDRVRVDPLRFASS